MIWDRAPILMQALQGGLARAFVTGQPAAHDDAGAPDASPAVHVHQLPQAQVGVDGIEDGQGLGGRGGHRNVADREALVGDALRLVGLEQWGVGFQTIAVFGQVDKGGYAGLDEGGDLFFGGLGFKLTGVFAGQELARQHPITVQDGGGDHSGMLAVIDKPVNRQVDVEL